MRTCAGTAVAVVLLAACSTSAPSTASGAAADSGFRPPSNGLPFANYGATLSDGATPVNLTAQDVRAMFGDAACADAKAGKCDLIPEAQAWLDMANKGMAGGHCYGFSVLADLLWQGKVQANVLGAPSTANLDISNNAMLQREIAYDWAIQLLDSVQSKSIAGTPNKVLAKLEKVLKPKPSETYTVGIFKPDFSAGHAITPYAVQQKGGGKVDVLVYDNNWPGATRAITFDTNADTWTYFASTNPHDPASTYTGDAKTKTLVLFPTSPGLGTQKCPFCAKVPPHVSSSAALGVRGTEEISLLGSTTRHANVVVTDPGGHRLGIINGRLVDEIRGAHVDKLVSAPDWADNMEPDFFVPADRTYTVTLDGSALTSPDTETLRVIGPSWDASVDDIPMRPGDRDVLVAAPDATKVSYTSSRAESPTLELGVSDTRADYAFAISGVSDQPGSTVTLGLPTQGGSLAMDNAGSQGPSTLGLRMSRETSRGVQVFTHTGVRLVGGDTARLEFGKWADPSEGVPLVTTHLGQRSTQLLSDQAAGQSAQPSFAR